MELLSCCGARPLRRRRSSSSLGDRCHSLASLFLPPAAVGSLPRFSLASPVQIHVETKKKPILSDELLFGAASQI